MHTRRLYSQYQIRRILRTPPITQQTHTHTHTADLWRTRRQMSVLLIARSYFPRMGWVSPIARVGTRRPRAFLRTCLKGSCRYEGWSASSRPRWSGCSSQPSASTCGLRCHPCWRLRRALSAAAPSAGPPPRLPCTDQAQPWRLRSSPRISAAPSWRCLTCNFGQIGIKHTHTRGLDTVRRAWCAHFKLGFLSLVCGAFIRLVSHGLAKWCNFVTYKNGEPDNNPTGAWSPWNQWWLAGSCEAVQTQVPKPGW